MVQTADSRHNHDLPTSILGGHRTVTGCLLLQTKMGPVIVIVADVLIHQTFEVVFIDRDHMIEKIPATASHEALRHAVLPRTAIACPSWFNRKAPDGIDDFCVEVTSAIKDQISGCGFVRKSLSELLRHPQACRASSDPKVNDPAPVMQNHKEAIEHSERQCGHSEEVHCSDRLTMIAQECRPLLPRLRVARCPAHPAQNRSFRDVEAEHLQFAVDAWCAPGLILCHHAKDEVTEILIHALPACAFPMPRQPRPIQPEPIPMPTDDGLGLHNDESFFPIRPQSTEKPPEDSIIRSKRWFRLLGFIDCKLLPESDDFKKQRLPTAKRTPDQTEEKSQRSEHEPGYNRGRVVKISVSNVDNEGEPEIKLSTMERYRINADGILAKHRREHTVVPCAGFVGTIARDQARLHADPIRA